MAHKVENRNACRVQLKKLNKKDHLDNIRVHGVIILK